jgi:hypothetical protein
VPENLADFFISPGYKQPIFDKTWEIIEEKWNGTSLEVFIKTKHPVYNPQCKYQFKPSVIECSFCLEKHFGWWRGSVKSAFVSNSFVNKYVRHKNFKLLSQRISRMFTGNSAD